MSDVVEVERCTGHCCRAFTIPGMDPDMLAWQPELWRMQRRGEPLPAGARIGIESDVIAKMVVPLGVFARVPTTGEPVVHVDGSGPAAGMFYTCRNLLPNGNCGIYSRRPAMCREYPYRGDRCVFRGCTRRCEVVARPDDEVALTCSAEVK